MSDHSPIPTQKFVLVVIQNPETKKFLAINETRNRGWWLPAGRVEPGESFEEAAHREVLEETGIKIKIEGILRIDHEAKSSRIRVLFFAKPVDDTPPKNFSDQHSEVATWLAIDELKPLKQRGPELREWGNYILAGGTVWPTSIMGVDFLEGPPKVN